MSETDTSTTRQHGPGHGFWWKVAIVSIPPLILGVAWVSLRLNSRSAEQQRYAEHMRWYWDHTSIYSEMYAALQERTFEVFEEVGRARRAGQPTDQEVLNRLAEAPVRHSCLAEPERGLSFTVHVNPAYSAWYGTDPKSGCEYLVAALLEDEDAGCVRVVGYSITGGRSFPCSAIGTSPALGWLAETRSRARRGE